MDNPLFQPVADPIRDAVFNPPADPYGLQERVLNDLANRMNEQGDAAAKNKAIAQAIAEKKAKPTKTASKEQFKAKAKKSVRDWTDNGGMQYIANVNPYAAAGMGFANQMANPFKQKYFESRADANEAEDARRLNYEIEHQRRREVRDDEIKRALNMELYSGEDTPDVSVSGMQNIIDDPMLLKNYQEAVEFIKTPAEFDTTTIEGRKAQAEHKKKLDAYNKIINHINLKYKDQMSDVRGGVSDTSLKNEANTRYGDNRVVYRDLDKDLKQKQRYLDPLTSGRNRIVSFVDELFHTGRQDREAKVRTQFSKLYDLLRKDYDMRNAKFFSVKDIPQEAAQPGSRLDIIRSILKAPNTYLVQAKSKNGETVQYIVRPDGAVLLSEAVAQWSKEANHELQEMAGYNIEGI